MLDAELSRSLLTLKEHIAREEDPAKLRELVVEIDFLLRIIDRQLTKLEGGGPPRLH